MPIAVKPTLSVGESGDAARQSGLLRNTDSRPDTYLASLPATQKVAAANRPRYLRQTRTQTTVTHAISRPPVSRELQSEQGSSER